ncbi:DNA/RNA non-specific endonuclease [Sinomonas halotolerans]|uniref:DNA/RNA non-specific endonuclease n=1 Tax=Sinomonas halotolerans TaxID=1644133 RepID=A0ABU9WY22_9MICC
MDQPEIAYEQTGYNPAFLSIPDLLPVPSRPGLLELHYTHFSVLQDPDRRLAASTGVNIDGAALVDIRRGGERWRLDPRIGEDQQWGNELYRDNRLDRGHLVRRQDPLWGDEGTAERANLDTFHYTVCAPQADFFNQGRELWLGLEDYILGHADTHDQRLSVFSGPVLEPDDPEYRGAMIPRRFFKIGAWSSGLGGSDGKLACTGYILDQSNGLEQVLYPGAREAPALGPYRTFQVPVEDIGELTGLDLGGLPAADRYAIPRGARGVAERWREIGGLADVTL